MRAAGGREPSVSFSTPAGVSTESCSMEAAGSAGVTESSKALPIQYASTTRRSRGLRIRLIPAISSR